jgi:hypothetical protein
MNKKIYWIPAVALILLSCSAKKDGETEAAVQNDFDVFCQQFTQVTQSADFAQLSSEERALRLESRLAGELEPNANAYIAWSAIRNGPPSERYALYKDAAASAGQKNWDCPAVQQYGHEVGSPHD